MTRLRQLAVRYPWVSATLLVAAVAGVLSATPAVVVVPWLLSGFALVLAAREGVQMVRAIRHGRWGLDLLALIAIVSTVLVGEPWAAVVIVAMLTGGEALEDYAAARATRELNALLARVPQRAHRMGEAGSAQDGSVEEIAADEIRVGDRILVRPSELVPVDGILLSAEGELDESSISGESLPVDHVRGDTVLSGAVNGAGALEITATAIAAESQYQRIVALVRDASASRAPMVRLADRYAIPFTVLSVVIATTAWIVSGDPVRFAEVLVVATPCPLLLAAPVAFLAGMSRSAAAGVVVKGAGVLEVLARAKTVAFDKTGTLTSGVPVVTEVRPVAPLTADRLLAIVAAAERYSSHVLAASLVAASDARGLPVLETRDAAESQTRGVEATVAGARVRVGKPSFVAEGASGFAQVELRSGEAAVYVAVDGAYAGAVIVQDRLRPEVPATLAALRRAGIAHSLMLTGDVDATARVIAAEAGITEFRAECSPQQKVDAVRAALPRPVIMVGDGVNDAPVLAVADVGIALGARGSTAAGESADAVVLVDDLGRVAVVVGIARRTVSVAVQSIVLGIAVSIGLMIVASTGVLPAIWGALLQEVVDLLTILNALRAVGPGRARPVAP